MQHVQPLVAALLLTLLSASLPLLPTAQGRLQGLQADPADYAGAANPAEILLDELDMALWGSAGSSDSGGRSLLDTHRHRLRNKAVDAPEEGGSARASLSISASRSGLGAARALDADLGPDGNNIEPDVNDVEMDVKGVGPDINDSGSSGQPTRDVSYESSKVMVVTALGLAPCDAGIGNWVNSLSLRNKHDYAKVHGYGLHWSVGQWDAALEGPWNKVAVLKHLADTLDPDRYQWLLWVDYDAIFGDMNVKIPFDRYEGKDMVVWATPDAVFKEGDAFGLNSGVVLLRLTDWTRAFLAELFEYGKDWWLTPQPKLMQVMQKEVKSFTKSVYEQNAFAFLLKTNLEHRAHFFPENWDEYVYHAQFDYVPFQSGSDIRPLFIVHWSGCQFCSPQWANHPVGWCLAEFVKRFAAADKQRAELMPDGPVPVHADQLLGALRKREAAAWLDPKSAMRRSL